MKQNTEKNILSALVSGRISLDDLHIIEIDPTAPLIFSSDGYFYRRGMDKAISLDEKIRDRILNANIEGLVTIAVESQDDIYLTIEMMNFANDNPSIMEKK